MLKKIIGFASLLISGAWWLGIGREFVKAIIFDRILHMLNPVAWPIATITFQYGPPILLAALGLYLLTKESHVSNQSPPTTIRPSSDIGSANGTTLRSTKLIAMGQYVLIGSAILAIVGIVLVFIGQRQNSKELSEPAKVVGAPTKAPTREPTPSPPVPVVPSSTPPQQPARTFVDAQVTPEYLVDLYKDNTTLRAETLIAEQLGKWMLVSGPLGEIHPGMQMSYRMSPTLVVFAFQSRPTNVYMWFSSEWTDRLSKLPRNQNISVVGQLKKVVSYNSTIELENCELVDSDPTTPTTDAPPVGPAPSTRPRRRKSEKSKGTQRQVSRK